ncbi:MAG: cytochrome C [Deltaproteobacteria bacterium]|nr:cytochrome C [Deltaproteobacteria bacterium]
MPQALEEVERPPAYLGSKACRNCHERQYESFSTHAKKSSSFQSITRLKKELTEKELQGCYFCHTTGYGEPGGFVNEEATPHLKNAGCEVCHGPGERHAATRRAEDIKGRLTPEDCEKCHTSDRVKAFRYKPLIHGGAH